MDFLKTLLAAAAVGTIVIAFRDVESGTWLQPALPGRAGFEFDEDIDEEPFLGYDGMDRDTLINWIGEAGMDTDSLERTRRYEEANLGRQPVLDAIEDLLG